MKPRIPPPVLMLAAAILMWILNRWLPLVRWIAPPWNQFGSAVAAIGLLIGVAAVVRMHQAHTTTSPMDPGKASRLVTDGVFRISRNPIYLSATLLMIGLALALGNLWFVVLAFVAGFTTGKVAIRSEEKRLALRFGKKYHDYAKRVRRWL